MQRDIKNPFFAYRRTTPMSEFKILLQVMFFYLLAIPLIDFGFAVLQYPLAVFYPVYAFASLLFDWLPDNVRELSPERALYVKDMIGMNFTMLAVTLIFSMRQMQSLSRYMFFLSAATRATKIGTKTNPDAPSIMYKNRQKGYVALLVLGSVLLISALLPANPHATGRRSWAGNNHFDLFLILQAFGFAMFSISVAAGIAFAIVTLQRKIHFMKRRAQRWRPNATRYT